MTFSTAVYIEAPPALVFDALSNLEEAKEWMPNFVSIEMLTPGPVGAGTEWLQTRRTFGKQSTEHFRVKGRAAYVCDVCLHHTYPMVGTIYEKSSTPLRS